MLQTYRIITFLKSILYRKRRGRNEGNSREEKNTIGRRVSTVIVHFFFFYRD